MGGPWKKIYKVRFDGDERVVAVLDELYDKTVYKKLAEVNSVRDAANFLFQGKVTARRLSIDPKPPVTAMD
jgi:hypothetical protein